MQANRSTGTKPERMLAQELWHRGYRYRKNVRGIPGTPDICFKNRKVAVFVDGDFWHGRDWLQARQRIKSNKEIFNFALSDAEMDALRALDTNKGIHDPDRPGVKEMLLGAFDVHAND